RRHRAGPREDRRRGCGKDVAATIEGVPAPRRPCGSLGVVPSRYHEIALRQLSREYVVDPARAQALEKRCVAIGFGLPQSFVEWYVMRDGIELLYANSNDDEPLDIARLAAPCALRWGDERDFARSGLL